MYTQQTTESANSRRLAYGRKLEELLSQNDAAGLIDDLWDMYTGYTVFSQQSGYDHRGHERFMSFKELVFFFQEVAFLGKKE